MKFKECYDDLNPFDEFVMSCLTFKNESFTFIGKLFAFFCIGGSFVLIIPFIFLIFIIRLVPFVLETILIKKEYR